MSGRISEAVESWTDPTTSHHDLPPGGGAAMADEHSTSTGVTVCHECGRCERCGRKPKLGCACICTNQPKCRRCGAWIRVGQPHECRMDRAFDLRAEFEKRVRRDNETGCWLWTGRMAYFGYGVCPLGGRGRRRLAHRVSYELFIGPITDGLSVLHKCDVTACVNPDHLFLGTQGDNMRDCRDKGRMVMPDRKGEHNGRAKLTPDNVREIRKLTESMTNVAISKRFNVNRTTIDQIVNGNHWTEI